ncbi:UDP-N-acetylglucosamine 4,6-dehydratase (inverting) [Zavarzinia sp. CC-PAN008]|uniref:UDP-N-acetylglucosamine 4,6-dehydratase (inverting) n=1 Tax=Zavarzinia sp. CC-PAN008 TaxID=3243332 RepID=UPI003F743D12
MALPAIDLEDKSILVTGGTGSFGKAFARALVRHYQPRRLIVFSRDEMKQFDMQTMPEFRNQSCMRFFLGDVRDQQRLELAMRDVDYVIHAAALKQVPAAEYNPMEAVNTNIKGAENVVMAALHAGVQKVVALSTDKAANPINLYGATKLASDKIFIAANNLSGRNGARFAVVRYGNVVGSRGSVIPFFRQLIRNGATSLPITDARMTRFWITVEQGVDFVLSSLSMMKGGELFVPKIPSMKITDMAQAIAPDLPTEMIGIRPGEKLHEIMISEDDARSTVELDDRYVLLPDFTTLRDYYARQGGRAVDPGFSYASNTNSQWLDPAQLNAILAKTEVAA